MEFSLKQRYYLLFGTSILLGLAWVSYGFSLFIALVPLLFLEDYFYQHKDQYKSGIVFRYSYVIFVLWHSFINWWVGYASIPGIIMVVLLNSSFYALVF